MSRATTIQQVLDQLDNIIEECIQTNNRLGLFAFIYRRTTAEILKEIKLKNFKDNARLEVLDVEFANLYLDAYKGAQENKPVRKSWAFAFENQQSPLTILQHIMMGMNAHINLDLAIATSTVMEGAEITDIEHDFDLVNDILFNIINEMQDRLSRVSPLMFLLDLAGKNTDEKIIDFSMRKARGQSWNTANLLWSLGSLENSEAIDTVDSTVLKLSQFIKSPKSRVIGFLLRVMHTFETKDVGKVITKLRTD